MLISHKSAVVFGSFLTLVIKLVLDQLHFPSLLFRWVIYHVFIIHNLCSFLFLVFPSRPLSQTPSESTVSQGGWGYWGSWGKSILSTATATVATVGEYRGGLKLKIIFILFLKQFEICSSKCPWAQSDFLICLFCTKPKEFIFAVVNEKEKSNKPSHLRGWTKNMFDIFVQKLLKHVVDYQTRWQFIFFKLTPNHSVLYTIFMVVGFLTGCHLDSTACLSCPPRPGSHKCDREGGDVSGNPQSHWTLCTSWRRGERAG